MGQLRQLKPDFGAIAEWTNATAATGVAIFAFEPSPGHQLAVRAFCPGDAVGVPEDPVTGSANAAIAAALLDAGRLPATSRYIVSQGREVGFDARLHMRIDADGEVWSGGHACTVVQGRIDWPE